MSKMIDRVALALAKTTVQEGDNIIRHIDECCRLARAAIEAMREPTEEMIEAAWASALNENAASVWRNMIDAALGNIPSNQ